MQSYIKSSHIANEVRMKRKAPDYTALLVEGDTDRKFYGKFIDNKRCGITIAHSKDKVVEATSVLCSARYKAFVSIVDSDFWYLKNIKPGYKNLFITDTHDLETLLIKTPALENIIKEFCDESKLKKMESSIGKDVRDLLLHSASELGYFRFCSLKRSLNLRFRDLNYYSFVSSTDLSIDIESFLDELFARNQERDISKVYLAGLVSSLKKDNYNSWHVCCGDDIINILLIGIKEIFGLESSKHLSHKALQGALRLACEYRFFCKTDLYRDIIQWEDRNKPHRVFSEIEKYQDHPN